jgi:tetratricopeptide (TPR) repeat protein
MGRVEKTVFISYRRTNLPWALAIYQNLTAHGYDVFFDYETIASGDFEQVILGNIRARAHFLVILTPSALERCNEPGDWLRREIESALDEKRNIVPIFLEGFDFSSPSIANYLTGKLTILKNYNGQSVPAGFFFEAMDKLRNKFLNVQLEWVLHPISRTAQKVVQEQQIAADEANDVKENELTAQELLEQGLKYVAALNNQGDALATQEDFDGALNNFDEAIRLKPDYALAYSNRSDILVRKGDFNGAVQDSTKAIELDPNFAGAYNNRGVALIGKQDYTGAIRDFTRAIDLKYNNLHLAYFNRGIARKNLGDLDGAIQDYTEAIEIKRNYNNAYRNRGNAWWHKGDFHSAMIDYQKYLDLGGTDENVTEYLERAKKKVTKR